MERARRGKRDEKAFSRATESRGTVHETTDIHKLLVDSVRDYAIFALDRTGHILTWNAGARRLKGYEPHEIIGKHFSIFYPPEALAINFPEHELEVAAASGRFEDEGWRVRKDGTTFWANVVINALRDESGSLIGFAKVTRDLTERKRAEEQLRASEERFSLLVRTVRDYGIFMLDPDGIVASWNDGARHIKGYQAHEIIGKHFSTFYPPEDLANGKPAMELRVASKEGRFEDEGWRVKKDGTRFWANVVITALRDGNGDLVGFAKVTRDLTERRAAEEKALEDARRIAEAEAANRAKADFLAAMSHELRTPLNAISGYTELLLLGIHGPVTDDQREALERVRTSQKHLLALITDLLNFSKIEAGAVTYEVKEFQLANAIEAVKRMIEPQAAAKRITIEWQEADRSIVALADESKTQQILLNLLTNAVKFTEDGGRVTISHFQQDGAVALEVRDNGIGLPEDKIDAVFEPFVQIGRSLTSAQEGTGLGLAISRDLARAMGGDLTAVSKLNEGSAFTLTLPRPN